MNNSLPKWTMGVRLIHWGLALLIIANMFVLEEGDPPHTYVGYVAVALVLIRSIWGLKTRGAESFRSFPVSRAELKKFTKGLRGGKTPKYEGHNPAASMTYFAMWSLVVLLGISGWMMELDAFWGEDWLEETHEVFSDALLVLIVFHLVGILLDSFMHKRKTWMAMISGEK